MKESPKMRQLSKKKMSSYLQLPSLPYDSQMEGGLFVDPCVWLDLGYKGNLLLFYFTKKHLLPLFQRQTWGNRHLYKWLGRLAHLQPQEKAYNKSHQNQSFLLLGTDNPEWDSETTDSIPGPLFNCLGQSLTGIEAGVGLGRCLLRK